MVRISISLNTFLISKKSADPAVWAKSCTGNLIVQARFSAHTAGSADSKGPYFFIWRQYLLSHSMLYLFCACSWTQSWNPALAGCRESGGPVLTSPGTPWRCGRGPAATGGTLRSQWGRPAPQWWPPPPLSAHWGGHCPHLWYLTPCPLECLKRPNNALRHPSLSSPCSSPLWWPAACLHTGIWCGSSLSCSSQACTPSASWVCLTLETFRKLVQTLVYTPF